VHVSREDPLDCLAAYDRHTYLQANDMAQFLYRLRKSDTYKAKALPLVGGVPLGCARFHPQGESDGESSCLHKNLLECQGPITCATAITYPHTDL
jgi:hypothetical protein